MLEERALVTRTDHRFVYVKSMQSSACTQCLQKQNCSTALYAKLLPNREMALISPLDLKAGDRVVVGIGENHLLRASLFVYLLPLLIMLIPVGFFDGSEQASALLAIFSMLAGLYLIHRVQRRFTQQYLAPPQIIKKL